MDNQDANSISQVEDKTLEQFNDQTKPKTTEEKKIKAKNPKRVEQGKKLAEWNKANKQRLSPQSATMKAKEDTKQKEVIQPKQELPTKQEADDNKTPLQKPATKNYVIIAETILIIGLVGVGLFYFINPTSAENPTENVEVKKSSSSSSSIPTNAKNNVQQKDDMFEM